MKSYREAGHSPPISAEVRIRGSIHRFPHTPSWRSAWLVAYHHYCFIVSRRAIQILSGSRWHKFVFIIPFYCFSVNRGEGLVPSHETLRSTAWYLLQYWLHNTQGNVATLFMSLAKESKKIYVKEWIFLTDYSCQARWVCDCDEPSVQMRSAGALCVRTPATVTHPQLQFPTSISHVPPYPQSRTQGDICSIARFLRVCYLTTLSVSRQYRVDDRMINECGDFSGTVS
jgi:hypothetical protein